MPTRKKNVVEKGVLQTLLHNLTTAAKQGVATTGNAARGYASAVGVAPSNFYIAPSQESVEAMLARMGEGFLITEVSGLHAGANQISGDFSLLAKGFAVRGGQKAEPVEQITVAGNFFAVLKDVVAVADDLPSPARRQPGGQLHHLGEGAVRGGKVGRYGTEFERGAAQKGSPPSWRATRIASACREMSSWRICTRRNRLSHSICSSTARRWNFSPPAPVAL